MAKTVHSEFCPLNGLFSKLSNIEFEKSDIPQSPINSSLFNCSLLCNRCLCCHETELILHDGAENMLKRFGINPKNIDVEKLRSDYNALYSKKQALQKTYKSTEKEAADLNRKLDNLNQYLDRTPEQQIVNEKAEKSQKFL